MNEDDIGILVGKTLIGVTNNGGEVIFRVSEREAYRMFHYQSCCENVRVEEIHGDLYDLVGAPILQAEEVSNADAPKLEAESYTWTFYKFATLKGHVTIRWLGTSNGYYSERVDFERIRS